MDNVSAVLITRHKEYPKEIVLEGFSEVIVKIESPNVYQRYLSALDAKNEIIYVQDDDAIVDYRKLWGHYNGQLTNGMTPHHQRAYAGTGATLVGWGCFFPKEMLISFSRYIECYGDDFHFYREADRIFTVLNQPHNTLIMGHEDLPQIERMSHEPSHYEWAKEAIVKTKALL